MIMQPTLTQSQIVKPTLCLLILLTWIATFVYSAQVRTTDPARMTNEALVAALSSKNGTIAHGAVIEILKRGELMIPMLLECKGNKKAFYGYGLGDPNSAFLIPVSTGKTKDDRDRVITVEVAALYLI